MTTEGLNKFVAQSGHKLKVYGQTVERRHTSRGSGGSKKKEEDKRRKEEDKRKKDEDKRKKH